MEARDAAVGLARGRIAIGLTALVAPKLASRAMFGRRGATAGTVAFARMLGGRDVALGLGVVIALDRGAPVRGWLEAGALADGADFASALLARRRIPRATVVNVSLMAAAAALAGIALSRRLDSPQPASSS
ncbi:MAG TPA: hypothetical protein VH391_09865 [Solirubrobacterales bacterium]|jgi:hypothetical protein